MSKTPRPEAYTDLQEQIGQRIAWARELVFPNRSELARIMEIDASTLAHIEAGSRSPSIFNVIELSNRLRVSTDYILKGLLTSRTDEEMALRLAAFHPELVLGRVGKVEGTDTGRVDDTQNQTKTPARVG